MIDRQLAFAIRLKRRALVDRRIAP